MNVNFGMKNICASTFFLLAFTGSGELKAGQSMSAPEVKVTGPRPLRDALVKIEEQLGTPINFEEARNEPPSSVVGERDLALKNSNVFPVGGTLTIRFVGAEQDPLAAVNTALVAYKTAGLPGEYEAHQHGRAIDVFPTKSVDRSGAVRDVIPVLSRPVNLQLAYRTTDEAVRAVAGELPKQIGTKIVVLISQSEVKKRPG
jgi:hypothetical protein